MTVEHLVLQDSVGMVDAQATGVFFVKDVPGEADDLQASPDADVLDEARVKLGLLLINIQTRISAIVKKQNLLLSVELDARKDLKDEYAIYDRGRFDGEDSSSRYTLS